MSTRRTKTFSDALKNDEQPFLAITFAYGQGTYASRSADMAAEYTGFETGVINRMALDKSAKVIPYSNLKKMMADEYYNGDEGFFAAAKGYDAAQLRDYVDANGVITLYGHTIIYNRTKLIMQGDGYYKIYGNPQ